MKSKEYTRQVWREAIYQSFASQGNSSETSISLADKYDALTEKGGMSAESAANIVLSCYSANAKEVFTNVKSLVDNSASASDIADYIHSQLKLKSQDYAAIEKDSLKRLREVIRRHSKNLDTLSTVTIDNHSLTEQELDAAKGFKLPSIMSKESYSAKASVSSGKKVPKMELEVFTWR